MYIDTQTEGFPIVGEYDIRRDNPNTLFGEGASFVAPERYAPLTTLPIPEVGQHQRLVERPVECLASGEWVKGWGLIDWTADELAASVTMGKARKWEAIKAERDRRRFDGGVKVGDHWFLSTAVATGEYTALILLSNGLPETTVLRQAWRTMDGATGDMTPALVKQIIAAGFTKIAAIDDAAQAHRGAMEASTNPATYDFSTGWPPVFGE